MRAHLLSGCRRIGRINFHRHSGSLGQKLRLATPVHGDEPPRRFFYCVSHREQPMIAENYRLALAQSLRDSLTFRRFINDARKIREHRVVLVKRAGILCDGIEQAPERGPGFPVRGVGVRGRNHVRARRMHARVNCERRCIHRILSFHYVAAVIHENQIRGANLAEVHPEWIHPEMIQLLRIARGDVSCHSLVEAEARK